MPIPVPDSPPSRIPCQRFHRHIITCRIQCEAVCFQRIWCCYEVYTSIMKKDYKYDMYTIPPKGAPAVGITDGPAEVDLLHEYPNDAKHKREKRFPLDLTTQVLDIKLQEGKTSRPEDRKRILNSIAKQKNLNQEPPAEHPEYEVLNGRLRGMVAHASLRDALEDKNSAKLLKKYLDHMHRCDLQTMVLSFDSCKGVTDKFVEQLADTIGEQLTEISLDFSFCMRLSDAALQRLAEALKKPKELSKLDLSFMTLDRRQSMLSDDGLQALAAAIPRSLECLALNLQGCKGISDRGVGALVGSLPANLCELVLNLPRA